MDKDKIIRFGIASKGIVCILLGGLAVLAAVGLGGEKTDSDGALDFLADNLTGQFVLGITAAGLVSYVFWRFYQTFIDPEEKGTRMKGLAMRIGYFSSGLIYAVLAFSAIQILFGSGGNGSGGNSMVSEALSQPYGQIIAGSIACIYLGKAIYQIHRVYSGNYRKKVQESRLSRHAQKLLVVSGVAGYTSRGIIVGVIAWLTFRAAITSNSDNGGGTKEAFEFIQNEFGILILGVIALGLFLYGIFMLIKARYRKIDF